MKQKETANIKIRVTPTIRRKLKIIGAKKGRTINQVIEELLKRSK